MLAGPPKVRSRNAFAVPYCECSKNKRSGPVHWEQLSACTCGEETDLREWKWEHPSVVGTTMAVVSQDHKQVLFHPSYSSGTAVVRGDTPLQQGQHHYWEVKMLTDTYGTDIMIGVGTDKVNSATSQFRFTSLLGSDTESYGLSYHGLVRHGAAVAVECAGFCRGSIVGVRLDLWRGTLEFYLNRQPQGIAFYNMRRHNVLYPMVCSTAAQSCVRLTYAASWRASLLVEAAKMLAASARRAARQTLPPGLGRTLESQFWLTLPTEGCMPDEAGPSSLGVDSVISKGMLPEIMSGPYANGYYVDNVDRCHRLVLWE